jgi:hypothetical protein
MDIEFIKRNDALVNWLDENHKGKWSSCKSTFDTIVWKDDATDIPTQADYDAVKETYETAVENKINQQANLKTSAKAKLVAGEALTEEEANTIVL